MFKRFQHSLFSATLVITIAGCSQREESRLNGEYRFSTSDRIVQQMMAVNNTYFLVFGSDSILYHTEINGKSPVEHRGSYVVEQGGKALLVNWTSGNIRRELKLIEKPDSTILLVGEALYLKQ